jgi:putative MATE family efflux protein
MQQNTLTEGPIIKQLIKLTLPIMGTSFIQMAYNLTDMFWIGFQGALSVAAVGIGGFFVWLAMAFIILSKLGTEIKVAQSYGAKDYERTKSIAATGVKMTLVMAVVYAVVIFVFNHQLIAFFNTQNALVDQMSETYLKIVTFGFVGLFLNQIFTGLFNAVGNSRTPFVFNSLGLAINIIMDPLLILGIGPLPEMGVSGAAIATVFSQLIVMGCFIYAIGVQGLFIKDFTLRVPIALARVKEIIKMGLPPALQSGIFTLISMIIARLIADFGATPVAVQKVGSQIESITWMTASGFSVALGAFVGQNYGAGHLDRVKAGHQKAVQIAVALGLFNTALLFFGAKVLFMIFIREPVAVLYGIDYLRILALSQLFMCVEITVSGVFNGLGYTQPPALVGVVFNVLRIPMAIYFVKVLNLGINGIWWSITLSSVFKGIISYVWITVLLKEKIQPEI